MMAPRRYIHLDEARLRHGDRVERFAPMFYATDPLADAVVEALADRPRAERDALVERALREGIHAVSDAPDALVALFAELDRVPMWVDLSRAERGGRVFHRSGPLGGLVLGVHSLVLAYCSPAGNKPLVFSGRLEADAPRRLAETSRFVQAVTLPGAMRRHGEGFACTVKVRLVHAAVRRMLRLSGRFREDEWGAPINQADMAGTTLLFSHVVLDGLGRLGFHTTRSEREDLLHLWRYVGYLLGVNEGLRSTTEHEARNLWDLLASTQAPPDDDSRALAKALIESGVRAAQTPEELAHAERMRPVAYAISRTLIGDDFADRLGFPRTPLSLAIPAFRAVFRRAGKFAERVPGASDFLAAQGQRYWHDLVRQGLRGMPASFEMPDALAAKRD
jgi:hypothetical protein